MKDDSIETNPFHFISAEERLKHFSDLFEIKQNFLDKQEQFLSYLHSTLDLKTFSELDVRMTDKEVLLAVKNLKNNKACDLDGIKNEMLKIASLISCLV